MRRRSRVSPRPESIETLNANQKENASKHAQLSDIQKQAIQVFYTEGHDRRADFLSIQKFPHFRVLHPNGKFRSIFDFFTVIWVLVLVYMIPFQIGFDWYKLTWLEKMMMNILDVWFGIDIVLNFRTGYIHHGTIIMDPKRIVKNYLTTWFLIDLLGTFPFERFVNGESTSRKSLKLIKYFKIPKLLRISRVMKYVRDHKFVYDIFQVFVLVITFLHIGACVWMAILNPCAEISDALFANDELCSQGNVDILYAESFHLSTTMMLGVSNSHVIGDSSTLDILTERRERDRGMIYTVSAIFMVGGLFLVALLISELNIFLFGKMQGSAAFQRKINRVTYEMEYYAVPDELQLQVKAFYDYIWIHQKQYDDRVALLSDDQMSTDLQRKLALHLFKDVVSHISIFSEIDDLLLGEICLSLRTKIFLPGDMILFKGDVGKELFIIAKGVVEVLRDDLSLSKRKLAPPILLTNGSFFGEIALIMETRRTCSVQAQTVCEVNILEQRTFDTILRENPDFARRMNELVVARQLERSISKSAPETTDVKVSKDDMDVAISMVENDMKQGLDRRMREEQTSTSFREISERTSQRGDQHSSTHIHIASEITKPQQFQNTSSSRNEKFRSTNQVIDDIARRSTRFVNTVAPQQRQRSDSAPHFDRESTATRNRSHSDNTSNASSSISNDYSSHRTERMSSLICKNDKETCSNFNPNSVVDISKVLPSILNNGDHNKNVLLRIEHTQQKIMDQLASSLSKTE